MCFCVCVFWVFFTFVASFPSVLDTVGSVFDL